MANRKTNIATEIHKRTIEDSEGHILTSETQIDRMIRRSTEPDYIKIYTKMWCEFNQIPELVRPTFLQLVMRMSYCNANDLATSQIVYTTGVNQDCIMDAIGISNVKVFYRHLQMLVDCDAIRPVYRNGKKTRGCYQINPQYAGRGAWRYNVKEQNGGVEDLVALFNFKTGEVKTKIQWAEHGLGPDAEDFGLREDEQIYNRETHVSPFFTDDDDDDRLPSEEAI